MCLVSTKAEARGKTLPVLEENSGYKGIAARLNSVDDRDFMAWFPLG